MFSKKSDISNNESNSDGLVEIDLTPSLKNEINDSHYSAPIMPSNCNNCGQLIFNKESLGMDNIRNGFYEIGLTLYINKFDILKNTVTLASLTSLSVYGTKCLICYFTKK
jgi:hypothetical protein